MPADAQRARDVFLAVADLLPIDRPGYLKEMCGHDADLREAVDRLLAAHAEPAHILAPITNPVSKLPEKKTDSTIAHSNQPDSGTVLSGRYTLLEEIGEGGMGTVWMARQSEPVKRMVAIKLVKPGMDSKSVLTRFEAERQALALMDHPNIARVLDGGLTSDGRPFFVMDLVKGIPITQFCDVRKLTPRERLELFVPVCHAIQHAHQKGIIHRDIKPSNVLVALYDDRAVPKVIDFGVAKATGQPLTEQTLHTGFGTVMGTPQYMSPEQATFNNMDIDTRSDLFSLGVLLYELLTGSPPISNENLKKAGMMEMLRVVREDEPPRPSTRLSTAATLPSIAANRGTEPKKLKGMLRHELDWIVMKALEKDRTRRYETANGFAADILRYLSGEPVMAVPPSTGYRLRKFVKKNKGPVLAATTILLLLVAGVAASSWQAVRAMHAETKAHEAADDAILAKQAESERAEGERKAKLDALDAKETAKKAEAQALKRLTQIEKGNAILGAIFEDLDVWRVREGTEPLEAVLSQRLLKAASQLQGEAVGDPLMVATLQESLGNTIVGLGYPREAIPLFIKSRDTRLAQLGPEAPETIAATSGLAYAYREDAKYDLAIPLFEQIVNFRKAKKSAEAPETLFSMTDLGLCLWYRGDHKRATPLIEEVLKIRKSLPNVSQTLIMDSTHHLALCYLSAEKFDLALPLFQETHNFRTKEYGPSAPSTLTSMNDLACCYKEMGELDKALQLFAQTLKDRRERLGSTHPATIMSMVNLGMCFRAMGNHEVSIRLIEEALNLRKERDGKTHTKTFGVMDELGTCYREAGKLDLAISLLTELVKLRKAKYGPEADVTLLTISDLAQCYRDKGRLDQALPLFRETTEVMEKSQFQHRFAPWMIKDLIDCCERLNYFDQSAAWKKKWLPVIKEKSGAESIEYADQLATLGFDLLQLKKWSEAEAVLSESLAIRDAKEPESWITFNVRSMRGEALLGLGKLIEARPLILKGYEGLKERLGVIPTREKDRLFQSIERMVALYEAVGDKESAAKWRKEVPLKGKPEDNLLINGSFEEGPEVANYVALNVGSMDLPGWVVTRGQIDLIGTFWVAAAGKRSLDLHGSPGFGGVAQTFKTKKGKRYQVVFSLAGSGETVLVKKTGVSAAGQSHQFTFDSTGKNQNDMGWEKKVWEFEAVADETTLEIYTLENTEEFSGPTIDDVWVLPVPEKK